MPQSACSWRSFRDRSGIMTGSPSFWSASPDRDFAGAASLRTTRLIDDQQLHSAGSVRAELVLSVVLALIVATLTVHLALT